MQAAFLREDFARVAALASAYPEEAPQPFTAAHVRMSLWYALSLERLQRAGDALRELDGLKARLAAHPDLAEAERLAAETLFWDGEISRRAHEWLRARRAYHQLLVQTPQSIWRLPAQVGLGLVLFQQQAYDAAREQVLEPARGPIESPVAQDAVLLEGLCDLKLGRFPDAQRLFQALLAQPLTAEVRWQVMVYLSEVLAGLGRPDEALAQYQQVMTEGPASSWARLARFGIGWTHFQQQRYRESLEAFNEYVISLSPSARQRADLPWRGRTDSSDLTELPKPREATAPAALMWPDRPNQRGATEEAFAQLWFAQGRCLMELGDEAAALSHFDTLEQVFPEHPRSLDASLSRSELLERLDRLAEARGVAERLTRRSLTPLQHQQLQLRLGALDLAAGDVKTAQARFRSVADDHEPALRQAACNGLGDAALFLGHDEDAASWYEQAGALDARSPAGHYAAYQRGRLLLKAGRRQEAIEQFRGLSDLWNARVALALSYLMNGDAEAAREALRRAVQEASDSRQAARVDYYQALLAIQDGDVEEAKRLCREVSLKVPRSDEGFEAQLLLADLLAGEGSWETSLISLQPLLQAFDRLSIHRRGALALRLGHLARQAGSLAIAIRWYETAWPLIPSQQGELDYQIASCYEQGGDWVAASNRYRAIEQPPWGVRGRLAAAKLLERDAQWQDARRLYQSVVQQAVPEAKIAQERLLALSALEAESSNR
jgi:tetratricopeptide (TPR) repeat protein